MKVKEKPNKNKLPPKKVPGASKIVTAISDMMYAAYNLTGGLTKSALDTQGINDEFNLKTDMNGLVGVIEVSGVYQMVDQETYPAMLNELSEKWAVMFSNAGLVVDFVFSGGGKELVKKQLEDILRPSVATMKRLQLDLKPLIDGKVDRISEYCSYEECLVVIWTDQRVLHGSERKTAAKKSDEMQRSLPGSVHHGMKIAPVPKSIEARHNSTVNSFELHLRQAGIKAKRITCEDTLRRIRLMSEPTRTSFKWKPQLPENTKIRELLTTNKNDYSHLLPRPIEEQIFPNGAGEYLDTGHSIDYGNKLHGSCLVDVPCQTPTYFQSLFSELAEAEIPYRIRISMQGDGMHTSMAENIKFALNDILWVTDFAGTSNKPLADTRAQLQKQREKGGLATVKLRIIADTWVHVKNMDDPQQLASGKEALQMRIEVLNKSIQSWGSMNTINNSGDSFEASVATLPALKRIPPAASAVAPLNDALVLAPFTRPATIWDYGAMILRSADGKVIPYQPGSSKQKAWGEVIVAPMRYGKSMWQSARNFALLTAAGNMEFPYCMTADIGYSSSGLVYLIKYALPKHLQYLAFYKALNFKAESYINIFDLPVCARMPSLAKINAVTSFIAQLFENEHEGSAGIVDKLVKMAYENASDAVNTCKRYEKGRDLEVDEWMVTHRVRDKFYENHSKNVEMPWYFIVDTLAKAKQYHLAGRAQRYAVPTLIDVMKLARSEEIRSEGGDLRVGQTNENIGDYVYREIKDAVAKYQIIGQPSALDVGDARLIAFDLQHVVGDEASKMGKKQTAVMYMLAREVMVGRLKLTEDDLEIFPEFIRPYHEKRIKKDANTLKSINFDEFHRVASEKAIVSLLEKDVREGPKYKVINSFASQTIDDFPPAILKLCANRIVLGTSAGEGKKIADIFGLNSLMAEKLDKIHRPTKHGSTGIYIMDHSEDDGKYVQELMCTMGAMEIWAYQTTQEDHALRTALYEEVGVSDALKLLIEYFPEGECATFVESAQQVNVSESEIDFTAEIAALMVKGDFNRKNYLNSVSARVF